MRYLAILFLVACGSANHDWSQTERNDFLTGCLNQYVSASDCKCYLEGVEDRFEDAKDALNNIGTEYLIDVIDACEE